MNTSHDRRRAIVEDDRLSSLPDELIHKILSFIGIKHAVQTSVLSSRWRFIWTSMPYLNFTWDEFSVSRKLSKFVTHVLSGHNNQVEVSSVNLSFYGNGSCVFVEQILKYAFSHSIQQLNVACSSGNHVEFPHFLFSSQTLKHLSLTKEVSTKHSRGRGSCLYFLKDAPTLDFPALTTLYLHSVSLCCDDENSDKCIGFFSKCANLKNLTLNSCSTQGFKGLSICLPLLCNLILEDIYGSLKVVDVVAPQLKNLTIKTFFDNTHQYSISTPELAFLLYKGYDCLRFSTSGFPSLEKADICVSGPRDAQQIVCLLQHFHTVKCLTLNLEIVELLSSSMELMSLQSSAFANLKSLKIYPVNEFEVPKDQKQQMSEEVKKYLLDGSPGATVTMVSREEVRAMKDTEFIQELMTELRELLEQEKINTTEVQPAKMQSVQIGKYMKRSGKSLGAQIEKEEEKASDIICRLIDIKNSMARLPASNRAIVQPSFSTLCAEAEFVVSKIRDRMKMRCDENYNRLSLRFHELMTPFEQSP